MRSCWYGFKTKIYRERDECDDNQNDADQITQRNAADEKQRSRTGPQIMHSPKIRLHQNEQARRADDRSAKQQPKHRMHLPKLAQK